MKRLPLLLLAGATLIALAQALPAQTKAPAAPAAPSIKNPGGHAAADKPGAAPWQNCQLVLETYALEKNDALAGPIAFERATWATLHRVQLRTNAGRHFTMRDLVVYPRELLPSARAFPLICTSPSCANGLSATPRIPNSSRPCGAPHTASAR